MAQTELEQIALAMMMMAEDPERRRQTLQPMSTTAAVLSPQNDAPRGSSASSADVLEDRMRKEEEESDESGETTTTTTGPVQYNVELMEKNGNGGGEESDEVGNNYSINPNSLSTPSPSSPAGSLSGSSGGGGGGGANSSRRIFTPEFKQRVLQAFINDTECIGNQRATARKFNIHRRQVQKWLQQLTEQPDYKDEQSSDEQEQKAKTDKEADFIATTNSSSTVLSANKRSILAGKTNNSKSRNRSKAKMPIVAGKGPLIPQASIVSSSPSANLPSSSPLMNLGKSIGNIHHPLFQNNNNNNSGIFMGLTSPLLSMPSALEASSSRHSPPRHSPPQRAGNASVNGNGNLSTSAQRMLELVDELCYLYPSEDFSLLRTAMLKNEVSFTKLSPPIRRANNRKTCQSPTSSSSANDYITQQTLQMIKNQNEYLQLLQSGYANFSNFQESPEQPNGKYASWLHNPFAAAAAAGFNVPGLSKNGNGTADANNRKKMNNETSPNSYNFALPKAPLSNPKSKTVAAVLAATRNGSSATKMQNSQQYNKTKRSSQRRKMTNGRPPKQMCSPNNDDDFFDPTSMLEVVTSKPSPVENIYHHSSDSLGMDLSTTAAGSVIQRSPALPCSSIIRSKAMNKDYGFLSELGLIRKEDEESNGNSLPDSSTASLEHFVDSVLHQRRSSPHTSSSGSPGDPNPVNESKDMVLEAFNFDPEMAGDPRAVARKFGLNIRIVQKWIREAPTRSIVSLMNGNGHNDNEDTEEDFNENLLQKNVISSTPNLNGPNTTVNKRKNPKPNQICDFTTEDDLDENGALDMVVPIKKRRLSTPTPTSA